MHAFSVTIIEASLKIQKQGRWQMQIPESVLFYQEDFHGIIENSKLPVMVIFGTKWCQDTKRMVEKALAAVLFQYQNRIRFFVVMLEDQSRNKLNDELKEEYRIERYPTVICFWQGKEPRGCRTLCEDSIVKQIFKLEALAKKILTISEKT
jgi:thiol-disulfide isomerase/thioredoxin